MTIDIRIVQLTVCVQLVYGSVTVNAEFNKTQVPFTIEKIRNYFNHMQILILTNEILAAV